MRSVVMGLDRLTFKSCTLMPTFPNALGKFSCSTLIGSVFSKADEQLLYLRAN